MTDTAKIYRTIHGLTPTEKSEFILLSNTPDAAKTEAEKARYVELLKKVRAAV